ncbi:hypothetical protein SELMODRAFT_407762 [Selaginella moellendorffii]|uniref:Jacalin-type lectin domain-containing protein n=1 Tax=Selaginella moellendorffii TaxID=88036 RepID=D8R6N6_SELML|nr:hypothetical protein SELMODRAFT_407762 [Selaginella moellendorffii]
MTQLLIMALLIGVVIAGATASFPGRYHLLGTKKIYVQIVGRTVGSKTQTEFPVSGGPVQQFPNYTPGYQATYSAKFTKALDYFSAQLGTITGFVGATTNTSTFQTGTIAFKDGSGSIYFSGTADGSLSSKAVVLVSDVGTQDQ